jgi:transposase
VIGRQSAGGRIIASLKLKALKATGAVRCAKDLVEEALFERRRDLFSEVESVFFDTASLYFEGHHRGESIDRLGHTKDHRPDFKQMVIGMRADGGDSPCFS